MRVDDAFGMGAAADGTTWMSGTKWQRREAMRISVVNWRTDGAAIERAVGAVRSALSASRAAQTDRRAHSAPVARRKEKPGGP